jgi:hypothetical protein
MGYKQGWSNGDTAGQCSWDSHYQLGPQEVSLLTTQVLELCYKPQSYRDDFAKTERLLKDLGADVVLTYDDVADDERAREVVGDKVCESQCEG